MGKKCKSGFRKNNGKCVKRDSNELKVRNRVGYSEGKYSDFGIITKKINKNNFIVRPEGADFSLRLNKQKNKIKKA